MAEWSLLSEGGLNFAFVRSDCTEVVRIRKAHAGLKPTDKLDTDVKVAKYTIPDVRSTYLFYKYVIRQLIPSRYIPKITLDKLQNYRPHISPELAIEKADKHCLLMENCASIAPQVASTTVAFEIKPKSSIVFDLHGASNSIWKSACRFCLQQKLKLKAGTVAKLSGYCPAKLYSGLRDKFGEAIAELINNPQNNLKIFSMGRRLEISPSTLFSQVLTPLGVKSIRDIGELLWKSLHDDCAGTQTSKLCDLGRLRTSESGLVMDSENPGEQYVSEILYRLQQLQHWDELGPAEAQKLLQNLTDVDLNNLVNYSGTTWSDLEGAHGNEVSKLAKYLTSLTFKDLSLVVAVTPIEPADMVDYENDPRIKIVQIDSAYFIAKVSLIDFDPKPIGKIKRYKQLYDNILIVNGLPTDSVVLK